MNNNINNINVNNSNNNKPESHVSVVSSVDESAAETHVQAADNHDAARYGCKENKLQKRKILVCGKSTNQEN